MIKGTVKIPQFKGTIDGVLAKYTVEVGVLEAKYGNRPKGKELKSFAGGQARKAGKKGKTLLSYILSIFDKKHNLLIKPWSKSSNADVLRVISEMVKDMSQSTEATKRRFLNACQAVVRNPILRQEYGKNKPSTAKRKGFNRYLIDVGSLFNNIKARFFRV